MSVNATHAPALAMAVTMPSPIPRAPPVTIATFPVRAPVPSNAPMISSFSRSMPSIDSSIEGVRGVSRPSADMAVD